MRNLATCVTFAALLIAGSAGAQHVESTFDVSAMSLSYADSVDARAVSLTPDITADWQSITGEATGTYSEFMGSGRSVEAALSASRFIATHHDFFGELAAFAGGSVHSAGGKTGEILANARVHIPIAHGESFFGGGGGRTWDGFAWRRTFVAEAGAAIGDRERTASITISPTTVGDSSRYVDAQLSATWSPGRAVVSVLAGFRAGDQLATIAVGPARKSWSSVAVTFDVTDQVTLLTSGGTYPIDPAQGFPGGRFMSVGLRVANPLASLHRTRASLNPEKEAQGLTPGDSSLTADTPGDSRPPAEIAPTITVTKTADDSLTITISAAGAERVELAGDFTNWDPISLRPAPEGVWSASFALRAGKYQMNVRINGGRWVVPASLLSISDEFGGSVGLLVVE